jgi:hypothetical protein
MAGANQMLTDGDGKTAYEAAVVNGNEEVARALKPLISPAGENISGIMCVRH